MLHITILSRFCKKSLYCSFDSSKISFLIRVTETLHWHSNWHPIHLIPFKTFHSSLWSKSNEYWGYLQCSLLPSARTTMWSMPVVLIKTENENDSANQNDVAKMMLQKRRCKNGIVFVYVPKHYECRSSEMYVCILQICVLQYGSSWAWISVHVHHTPPHFENLVLIQKEWVHMWGQDASQVGAVHI